LQVRRRTLSGETASGAVEAIFAAGGNFCRWPQDSNPKRKDLAQNNFPISS
jgi:hypothetical protein